MLISYAFSILVSLVANIVLPVLALKILSYFLKILMQFEFNSRAASMKNNETVGND
jgi:hypothetical protein